MNTNQEVFDYLFYDRIDLRTDINSMSFNNIFTQTLFDHI